MGIHCISKFCKFCGKLPFSRKSAVVIARGTQICKPYCTIFLLTDTFIYVLATTQDIHLSSNCDLEKEFAKQVSITPVQTDSY